jgi:hydroxymethylglutaryl-CoA lyase
MTKIIECPRDAMQGIHGFIPTSRKISYINQLLRVGFDTLDFGSFVSPKAIPQMKDTAAVLSGLDLAATQTRLLAIVANIRGAETASGHETIDYLGFPLSVSETFQRRNTNRSISEALEQLKEMQDIAMRKDKIMVTYLSMGFGNPYGDEYSPDIVLSFVDQLVNLDIKIISLADTVATAEPDTIDYLFKACTQAYPDIEFGAHFHSRPHDAYTKLAVAYQAGCRRFDAALKGYGGCPMANDELVGNVATEALLDFLQKKETLILNNSEMVKAQELANEIFPE